MNRNEEWKALLQEDSIPIPAALEGSVSRAKQRKSRRRLVGFPIASLAGVAAAFVLLVNLSLPFALACSSVPVLRSLAAAVAFSDSLALAVEHDYVQYSGQSQTKNGITVTIEYLILDKRQVNVFYTLTDENGRYLDLIPDLLEADGTPLHGYASSFGSPDETREELRHLLFEFVEAPVPDTLYLSCTVRCYESNAAEAPVELPPGETEEPLLQEEAFLFQFPLKKEFSATGDTVTIGQWVVLDGQRICIDTLDIYPTHVQVNVSADVENTAWLKKLYLHLEDEHGNQYGTGGGNFSAFGEPGTPAMVSYRLDTPYFTDAKHLNLVISGADWMDKENHWLEDMEFGKTYTQGLPETLTSITLTRSGGGIEIKALSPWRDDLARHSILSWEYCAEDGTGSRFTGGSLAMMDGQNLESYRLEDYPYGTISLEVGITHRSWLDTPITLSIR